MKASLFLFTLFALLLSGLANAEIYKWVDDKGQVHYQDHPRGDNNEKISVDADSATQKDARALEKVKTEKLIDAMEKSRQQEAKLRAKKLAEQRKQDEKCLKERSRLHKLEAKLEKNYSEFANKRPASYDREAAELADRKKYIGQYCN